MRNENKMKLVIGLVVLFAGLDLAILLSHTQRFVGIILIFMGIGLLLWAVKEDIPKAKLKKEDENFVTWLIDLLTIRGRLKPLLPVAGLVILVLVALFNIYFSNKSYLGSNDYVALILAGVLFVYNFVPSKYSVERDFAFLFSILLFVLLVIPTTILSLTSGEVDTNSPLTYYFLSLPTVAIVNLFGIPAVTPGFNPQIGLEAFNYIDLTGPDGFNIALHISLSCSGLYSVAIFTSAFIAFVAVDYKIFDRKVIQFLSLGIFLAWLANVLRMSIIVAVGRFYGGDTMVWVHNNIGEIIFMIWVCIFWLIMFKYLHAPDKEGKEPSPEPDKNRKGECAICGESLSPVISSARCECGAISHASCLLANENKCQKCGKLNDPS